jgi:uncharacterized protein YhhL (DUF1145 family)
MILTLWDSQLITETSNSEWNKWNILLFYIFKAKLVDSVRLFKDKNSELGI